MKKVVVEVPAWPDQLVTWVFGSVQGVGYPELEVLKTVLRGSRRSDPESLRAALVLVARAAGKVTAGRGWVLTRSDGVVLHTPLAAFEFIIRPDEPVMLAVTPNPKAETAAILQLLLWIAQAFEWPPMQVVRAIEELLQEVTPALPEAVANKAEWTDSMVDRYLLARWVIRADWRDPLPALRMAARNLILAAEADLANFA